MFVHSVVSYNRSMACNEKNLILAVQSGPCKEFLDEAWEECLLLLSLGHLSSMFLGMAMSIVLFSDGSEFVICSTYYLFLILKVMPKKAKSTNLFGMIFFEIADSFEISIRTLILYFKLKLLLLKVFSTYAKIYVKQCHNCQLSRYR